MDWGTVHEQLLVAFAAFALGSALYVLVRYELPRRRRGR